MLRSAAKALARPRTDRSCDWPSVFGIAAVVARVMIHLAFWLHPESRHATPRFSVMVRPKSLRTGSWSAAQKSVSWSAFPQCYGAHGAAVSPSAAAQVAAEGQARRYRGKHRRRGGPAPGESASFSRSALALMPRRRYISTDFPDIGARWSTVREVRVEWLVPRTRSSQACAASPFANFGFKRGTGIIELLVSL